MKTFSAVLLIISLCGALETMRRTTTKPEEGINRIDQEVTPDNSLTPKRVIIRFENDAYWKVRDEYKNIRLSNRDRRLTRAQIEDYVKSLVRVASETQSAAIKFLRLECPNYPANCKTIRPVWHQLWITNEISFRNMDMTDIFALMGKFHNDEYFNITRVMLDPPGVVTHGRPDVQPDSDAASYYDSVPESEYDAGEASYDDSAPESEYDAGEAPSYDSGSESTYDSGTAPYYDSGPESEEYDSDVAPSPQLLSGARSKKLTPKWNHDIMSTQRIWDNRITGAGVTVGIVDSGVSMGHSIVSSRFRKLKGWFDGTMSREMKPKDEDNHGTCVASVIAGLPENSGSAVGVAPGAQFIACRAWDKSIQGNSHGIFSSVLLCMQFMICPTDPDGQRADCTLRPDIVNHSFTIPGDERISFTEDLFSIYEDFGILLVKAAGNYGPICASMAPHSSSLEYPLSVGSITKKREISPISARGPTKDGRIKPDLVAPGEEIRCMRNKPNSGGWWLKTDAGTSLAAAHVSGVAALLFSYSPALTVEQVKYILMSSAGVDYSTYQLQKCITNGDDDFRCTYGYGIINANNAICTALLGPFPGFNASGNLPPVRKKCPALCVIPDPARN